uniref:Alpha-protein kinase 3 n=1 Tax=Nomascus leucogenys TaxID=61853 RepID=A0A2I3H6R7_NOMLE
MEVAGLVYVLGQQPLARQGEGQSGLVPGRGPVLWLPGLPRSSPSWPAVDLAPLAPARKAGREPGPGSSTKGPVLDTRCAFFPRPPGPLPPRLHCRHQGRQGSGLGAGPGAGTWGPAPPGVSEPRCPGRAGPGEGQHQVTTARPPAINRGARQPRAGAAAAATGRGPGAGAWRTGEAGAGPAVGEGGAMGSRRAPSRGWGADGRSGTGVDGEDDGPVWIPSPASRSYLLSVRPETSLSSNRLSHPSSGRSTFCSIIAQLTEETQPLFETTLKSRSVSEDSDVRFTCIVTGYPEPEVTWYKDDTELDRYCGLPKYEITHQGNRHTLQLYRCREEDAAIYQASAQNSKGIVSCSGVLEVGTMTEYKIHQRWFAKLKRKAAAKLREIEQSWKHEKAAPGEADTLRKLSPDRFQRKRRLSGAEAPGPSVSTREPEGGTLAAWQEGETEPAQHSGLGLINSFASGEVTTNGEAAPENGEDGEHGLLTYICDAMELGPQRTLKEESGAKKKKKDEESKQGLRKPELEKAARSRRSSENCITSSDEPDSCGTQGPVGVEQVQTQSRGRAARGPGSSGTDNTRKPASAVGTPDKAQKAPAPALAPGQEVYFSLKDMYLENTRAVRPLGEEGPQTLSVRAPGESPKGKAPLRARSEGVPGTPGQPTHSLTPQPTRPFNRKRFAPPKPKGEATTDSKPISSLSQAPECGAQSSGKSPPQASVQVPTPPARRRHGTRDSPLQGQAGHRTPGEVLECQTTTAPTKSASSSSDVASIGCSTSGSQGIIEPMDMETQEDGRTSANQRTGSKKNVQADGKTQVDGRTRGDGTQTAQRTRADRKTQADAGTQESERPQSDRSAQKGMMTQGRAETQLETTQAGEKIQEDRKAQADKGTQEDRRMQGEKGMQSEGCAPTATEGQSEQEAATSLGPPSRTPELPPTVGPRAPPNIECFTQTPEGSCFPEKPGFLPRSEEAVVTASRNNEQTVLGPLSGNLMLPAQPPHEGSVEQVGGKRCQGPQSSGPVEAKQEDSPFHGPKEEQPGGVPCMDHGGCPPAGLSQEVPTMPYLPGTGLTASPKEGPITTPTSQHGSTAAFLPSEDQVLLSSAPNTELALGARRKRFLPKVRAAGDGEATTSEERESPTVSPRGPRKSLVPGSPGTPGRERRSPTQGRKANMLEVPRAEEELAAGDLGPSPKAGGLDTEVALDEGKQEALAKPRKAKDLLKAPQVIRKIRVEQFPDASGSLKLWCQFFNILSDSVLTWAKDQRPVGEVGRSAGDEGPAALAIVQASPVDCGVYRCTIHNEHGSASTDFCLSPEAPGLPHFSCSPSVGEEIEMTPMVFAKGLADSGCWGDKLFGRLVSEELRGGGYGCGLRKASQAKVIYGLEPIFESGRTCIIKVSSLLVFGPSSETSLVGRNYDVTIQVLCPRIQNWVRGRSSLGHTSCLLIIPLYLIYRPANNIPYATLEEDLGKPLESYCSREWGCAGAPTASSSSEAMQKCQTFQHWLYQWTNGSFLVTDLAGVDWKMTDVQIATKLRGYQGLKESCFPALLDRFASSHQCNAYCELLGLTPLKGPEAAHPQAKAKGSKSPSAGRKGSQLSPQPQKKGLPSPQGTRKSAPSSKATPQASEPVAAQLLGQPPTQEEGSKAQGMR